MSVIDTLLTDIETAVRGTGERRRHALLRRTTATMIDQIGELSEHHLAVFDDVLLSLSCDVETETRADLAERLADLTRVPKKTTRALALDNAIRVAKPLIERSPCLDDDTLIAIIARRDAPFHRIIARRRALPAMVLDQLIAHADEPLLVDIVGNPSCEISDYALRILAERALSHRPLYRILRTRPDLATRHIGAVIEAARYRNHASGHTDDMQEDMLSRALAAETAQKFAELSNLSLSSANGIAETITGATTPRHVELDELLAHHRIEEALATLATQTGLAQESVKRAFHAPQHEPLMFLLRSEDYPLATVMTFMRHKHGAINEAFEAQLSDAYCALARDTAKRIAAFMTEKQTASIADADMQEPLRHSA